jgi:hypothetical protein
MHLHLQALEQEIMARDGSCAVVRELKPHKERLRVVLSDGNILLQGPEGEGDCYLLIAPQKRLLACS